MRALATGDGHLGKAIHLSPTRLEEQSEVLRASLRKARELEVDALLYCGDLFEAREPKPEVYLAAEWPLIEHRDEGGPRVIMIPGNHCLRGTSDHAAIDVLAAAGLIELYRTPSLVDVAGTTVACLPWAPVSRLRAQLGADHDIDNVNAAVAELLVTIARDLREQILGPAVLMTHSSIEGGQTATGLVAEPHLFREPVINLHDLAALGFDAVIAGHLHKPLVIHEYSRVFYVGSPMPLDFGEGGFDHGVYLLDTDDPEFGLRFIALESPRFLTLDLDPDYGVGAGEVDGAYVRARIVAAEDEAREIDPRAIERALLGEGAFYAKVELQVERATRARVDSLDETVTEAEAFQLWLEANLVDAAIGRELAALDVDYRERVAV